MHLILNQFSQGFYLRGNEEHIQNVCNTINRRIPEKSKADVVLAADVRLMSPKHLCN